MPTATETRADHKHPPDDVVAERAEAFGKSMRGCVRGCGTLIAAVLLLVVLGYLVLGIYVEWVYNQHPN